MKLQILYVFLMTGAALSIYGQQVSSVTVTPTFHNIGIDVKFDGVGTGSNDAPTTDMDFYYNTIEYIGDDAISCDGAGINNRIYNNTMRSFLVGVSVAPAAIGPHYIFRNLMISWQSNSGYDGYPIKLNVTSNLSTNWVYLYHNTCFTNVAGQDAFVFKQYSEWHNVISRNNIYGGTNYALNSWPDQNPVDFDYDNLYTSHASNFISWEGAKYTTIAAFSTATSQEEHGVSYYPDFADTANGNYHLKEASRLIDKGVIIPGINDSFYNDAPDIGCFEFTEVVSIKPKKTKNQPKTFFCYSNPFYNTVTIKLPEVNISENNNPHDDIVLSVYNLRGRLIYKREIKRNKKYIVWRVKNFNSGKYVVTLNTWENVYRQEILIIK